MYCSIKCRNQHSGRVTYKQGGQKQCAECGNIFRTIKGNEKYCCIECREKGKAKAQRKSSYKHYGWTPTPTTCTICGKEFMPRSRRAKTCSDECRDKLKHLNAKERLESKRIAEYGSIEAWKEQRSEAIRQRNRSRAKPKKPKQYYNGTCKVCGNTFTTLNPAQVTCSKQCSKRLQYARKQKRIPKEQVIDKDITLEALYKRDSGVCYLCGGVCEWNDRDATTNKVGNKYPSIDHIIPVAKGGLHAWNNVRLAHFICNALKSDKVLKETESLIPENAYQYKKDTRPRGRQVSQYTKEGKFIATFISTTEAERQTGIKKKGIQNCARNECKSYGGYRWEYPV